METKDRPRKKTRAEQATCDEYGAESRRRESIVPEYRLLKEMKKMVR